MERLETSIATLKNNAVPDPLEMKLGRKKLNVLLHILE